MKHRSDPKIHRRAAALRKTPTRAEGYLWGKLKKRKLGVKFRRQYVLNSQIIDFYCVSHRVAIELDGEVHKKSKEKDDRRDHKLNKLGIEVLRFSNQEVFFCSDKVLASIRSALAEHTEPENPTAEPKSEDG